jgi:two-component system, NarL family, nitrate/nitrite response regulator NarL
MSIQTASIDFNAPVNAPAFAPQNPIRVFIAEDHHITLWGLQRLIDASSTHMQVIGCASSLTELMNHDAAAQADVILLDLDLAGQDASASLAVLRQRCSGRVLILTAADDIAVHRAAVMKGARGVVHKSEPASTILTAIEKVNAGEVWLHRALLGEVLGMLTDSSPAAAPRQIDPDAQRSRRQPWHERAHPA